MARTTFVQPPYIINEQLFMSFTIICEKSGLNKFRQAIFRKRIARMSRNRSDGARFAHYTAYPRRCANKRRKWLKFDFCSLFSDILDKSRHKVYNCIMLP